MRYKLECIHPAGQKWVWVIRGLADQGKPDTYLGLVGLRHACDTPQSIIESVYGALYDHYQVTGCLADGDTVESDPQQVASYHAFDNHFGMVDVPAMRFRVHGYHITRELPEDHRCGDCGAMLEDDEIPAQQCRKCQQFFDPLDPTGTASGRS